MNSREILSPPPKETSAKIIDFRLVDILNMVIPYFGEISPQLKQLQSVIKAQSSYYLYQHFSDFKNCCYLFNLAPEEDVDDKAYPVKVKMEADKVIHKSSIKVNRLEGTKPNKKAFIVTFSQYDLTLEKPLRICKTSDGQPLYSPARISSQETVNLRIQLFKEDNSARCSFCLRSKDDFFQSEEISIGGKNGEGKPKKGSIEIRKAIKYLSTLPIQTPDKQQPSHL